MNNSCYKLFLLSVKELKCHKWLYLKISITFGTLVFLICLFSSYAYSLFDTQNSLKKENISANYVISKEEIRDLPTGTESFTIEHYSFVNKFDEWFNTSASFLTPYRVSLNIHGKTMKCLERYAWERLEIYAGEQILTNNDIQELYQRFGDSSCIIGDLPKAEQDVLVSETFLKWYGLTNDVIGQEICLIANNEENTMVLNSVTICGVLLEHFNGLRGHLYGGSDFVPALFLSTENDLFNDRDNVEVENIHAFSSWLNSDRVIEITSEFNCSYVGTSVLNNIALIENMQSIALKLFLVVGIALGCNLVLIILLMMDKLICVFSRDGGILLTCGMKWRELSFLLLCLLLWVSLFATVMALILSIGSVYIIHYIIYSAYRISIVISFSTVVVLFLIGILVVLLVAISYYLYAIKNIKKKTIKELLNVKIE